MEELAGDEKYKSKVNFLLLNLEGTEKAKEYASSKSLVGACIHASCNTEDTKDYGITKIPHKTLIGKDGKVFKNYENFQWSDIDVVLEAH